MRGVRSLVAKNSLTILRLKQQLKRLNVQASLCEAKLDSYRSQIDDMFGNDAVAEVELAGLQADLEACEPSKKLSYELEMSFSNLLESLEGSPAPDNDIDQALSAASKSNEQVWELLGRVEETKVRIATGQARLMAAYGILSSRLGCMSAIALRAWIDISTFCKTVSQAVKRIFSDIADCSKA